MPILDIEIVASDPTPGLPADQAQSLADAAAQVFGAPPGMVWVKVRMIPSTQYAEDHRKPTGVYPVFVTVLKSRARAEPSRTVPERGSIPEGGAQEDEIVRLTKTIAKVLNHPSSNSTFSINRMGQAGLHAGANWCAENLLE